MADPGSPTVTIGSGAILGVDAVPVTIEATMRGEGSARILGLVDTGVREAYYRVLAAFRACGLPVPRGYATINFTPADLRKTGSGFDLPMALAVAGAGGLFAPERTRGVAALGEISLEGLVLPARGVVAVALAARARGWTTLLVAAADAGRAAAVPGVRVIAVRELRDALLWTIGEFDAEPSAPELPRASEPGPDLLDIRGHETPKTALLVAAAGRHNLLLVGPPGSGKSALARRLPGLLPPPTDVELLEILKIHTAQSAAATGASGLVWRRERPYRAPHHSSSHVSLLGGGSDPRPGELTLAHHGVLFLDELPEFRREALEGLRQPLEDGIVTIGRARCVLTLPADCLLVAAMNPCPCGYLGHPTRPCVCTPQHLHRHHARLSGPLLDRIDLQVEVPALDPRCFRGAPDPEFGTARLRERMLVAVERQQRRNRTGGGWVPNGRLADRLLERHAAPGEPALAALERTLAGGRHSGRARVRLLRIARTLADLDQRDVIAPEDVLRAARLRGYERRLPVV